jgi:hypothetical protein
MSLIVDRYMVKQYKIDLLSQDKNKFHFNCNGHDWKFEFLNGKSKREELVLAIEKFKLLMLSTSMTKCKFEIVRSYYNFTFEYKGEIFILKVQGINIIGDDISHCLAPSIKAKKIFVKNENEPIFDYVISLNKMINGINNVCDIIEENEIVLKCQDSSNNPIPQKVCRIK